MCMTSLYLEVMREQLLSDKNRVPTSARVSYDAYPLKSQENNNRYWLKSYL